MKILLLENDFEIQQEVQETLYYKGYQIECVETLEEAEEALRCQDFDVFIADYNLQVVDSLSQLPRLYNEFPHLAILLTSESQQSFIPNEVMIVTVDCFEKPYPMHMLEQTILAIQNGHEMAFAA